MIANSFIKTVVEPSNATVIKLGKKTLLNPFFQFFLLQHDGGFSYVVVNFNPETKHLLMVTG